MICSRCLSPVDATRQCLCEASGFDAVRTLRTMALGAVLSGARERGRALFVALCELGEELSDDERAWLDDAAPGPMLAVVR